MTVTTPPLLGDIVILMLTLYLVYILCTKFGTIASLISEIMYVRDEFLPHDARLHYIIIIIIINFNVTSDKTQMKLQYKNGKNRVYKQRVSTCLYITVVQ